MLKIWKSYNVCPHDAVKSGPMNQYIKYTKGFIIIPNPMVQKALIDDIINAMDGFEVTMFTYSTKWKNWIAILDLKTCVYCRKMHGKIFGENEILYEEPPIHENCRCEIKRLKAIYDGYATRNGQDGADYWLIQYGTLPEYYMTKEDAKQQGWRSIEGNLAEVAPGMMIGGDEYKNRNGHLPQAEGRIWYEADINYMDGYRTRHRILYSNDGLVFVTYDHYETFHEIV